MTGAEQLCFGKGQTSNFHPPLCDPLRHHISIHLRDRKVYSSHLFSYRAQNQPSAYISTNNLFHHAFFFKLSLPLLLYISTWFLTMCNLAAEACAMPTRPWTKFKRVLRSGLKPGEKWKKLGEVRFFP